jgi:hypothetical protein
MNSREFFTQALLQAHIRTVELFLMNNEGDQLDIETADKLAETAFALAIRLTAEWESAMRQSQINDSNPDSKLGRENSTTDLCGPFKPAQHIRPDCGGHIDDHDNADGHIDPITAFPTIPNRQNLVQ